MSVERITGTGNKTGRGALVAPEKSGKSTVICETADHLGGIVIDCDDGTGLIRSPKTVVYAVDTFDDLLAAFDQAVAEKPGFIGIDDISVPWKKWTDYWGAKYDKGIPIHRWSIIKRPWFKLIHSVKSCRIPILISARINYSWETTGGEWKIDKENWSAQAEKGFLYEMDLIIKMGKKDGRYFGTIDGARTNRHNEKLAALVGKTFENINYKDHILPFFSAGDNGSVPEHIPNEQGRESGHEALEEKLNNETEEKQKTKAINQIQRGEKKCQSLKISGWQDGAQTSSTRITALGTDDLKKCEIEDLKSYVQGLKKQVELYNQNKLQEAS